MNFLHDLIDPGANWCPVCGEMRGVCQCDESDFMPEAADDWNEDDDPLGIEYGMWANTPLGLDDDPDDDWGDYDG